MDNNNLRSRLENYEFNDEQEFKLTLELINRIEKDIDTIKSDKSGDGYTISATIAGIAGAFYFLIIEFNKLTEIPWISTVSVLLAIILIGKLSWTFFQLIYFDFSQFSSQDSSRFRWTNHHLYDQRMNVLYQITIFVFSIISLFFLGLPIWVICISILSFAIYIFLLSLIFIFSYKNEVFSEHNENKLFKTILPVSVIITSIVSAIGLLNSNPFPIGSKTVPFLLAGMIFAILFFFNIAIVLSSPSLLLIKLEKLRRDIIFLKLELKDAWILYEIYMEGNHFSDELRSILEYLTYYFNSIEYHQTQKKEILSSIQEEIGKLEKLEELNEKDLEKLNEFKAKYFQVHSVIDEIYMLMNPKLLELSERVNKISRATKELEKAENYHQYILDRLASFDKNDEQLVKAATETDLNIKKLEPKFKDEKDSK